VITNLIRHKEATCIHKLSLLMSGAGSCPVPRSWVAYCRVKLYFLTRRIQNKLFLVITSTISSTCQSSSFHYNCNFLIFAASFCYILTEVLFSLLSLIHYFSSSLSFKIYNCSCSEASVITLLISIFSSVICSNGTREVLSLPKNLSGKDAGDNSTRVHHSSSIPNSPINIINIKSSAYFAKLDFNSAEAIVKSSSSYSIHLKL
jgi:hypothetical protein